MHVKNWAIMLMLNEAAANEFQSLRFNLKKIAKKKTIKNRMNKKLLT